MENGSVVAAIAAMAFVVAGVFQFLRNYVASSNKDYQELRDKYEALHKKNIELETSKLHWENRARLALASNRRLSKGLQNCQETLNSYLIKTQPIREEALRRLEDDTTDVPDLAENVD